MAIEIPRLPPSANPYELNITINVKLRPYFEIWYQRKKEAGETPKQFALRVLKTVALNDYLKDEAQIIINQIEADKAAAEQALNDDIQAVSTEVD